MKEHIIARGKQHSLVQRTYATVPFPSQKTLIHIYLPHLPVPVINEELTLHLYNAFHSQVSNPRQPSLECRQQRAQLRAYHA